MFSSYRLEAKKRNLRSLEPEASVASGGFSITKTSLLHLLPTYLPQIII